MNVKVNEDNYFVLCTCLLFNVLIINILISLNSYRLNFSNIILIIFSEQYSFKESDQAQICKKK